MQKTVNIKKHYLYQHKGSLSVSLLSFVTYCKCDNKISQLRTCFGDELYVFSLQYATSFSLSHILDKISRESNIL